MIRRFASDTASYYCSISQYIRDEQQALEGSTLKKVQVSQPVLLSLKMGGLVVCVYGVPFTGEPNCTRGSYVQGGLVVYRVIV